MCLIERSGILKRLAEGEEIELSCLDTFPNPALILVALNTLVGSRILNLKNKTYKLTKLGQRLADNISDIVLPFVGYAKLLSKQFQLLENPDISLDDDIDYQSIALASVGFGLDNLDPILLKLFENINPKGTICDLGCGTGEKLVKICSLLNIPGLGIEKSKEVIRASHEFTADNSQVEVIEGDATALEGIWEDVEVAMMSFVYHDIRSESSCESFLKSLRKHFPRLRLFVVIDIVSISEDLPTIMPGFDYVHGLQGFSPRDYESTVNTFSLGGFKNIQEIKVPNMPNTFIWALKPNDG